jgi:hypothetical protein
MAANNGQQGVSGLQIQGGAAIVAPVSAFPNGVPGNAMILLPINKPTDELLAMLEKGPAAVTPDQMWTLLGFNGPAVQVQDDQGRPIAIGLEDLLAGLEKHWLEQPDDLNRGRIYAQAAPGRTGWRSASPSSRRRSSTRPRGPSRARRT